MPYLDQGEFYSEFGNYDVRITLPENYVVASTGELYNEDGSIVQENNYRELELNPDPQKKTKTAAISAINKKEIDQFNRLGVYYFLSKSTFEDLETSLKNIINSLQRS